MESGDSSSGSTPPLLTFITLITYLISLTLVLSRPWLGLAYPSPHLTLPGVDLSTATSGGVLRNKSGSAVGTVVRGRSSSEDFAVFFALCIVVDGQL